VVRMLVGATRSSRTLVRALVTLFASLMTLLLTQLRGDENSWLPGNLEGVLDGTFVYCLLLVTFGLAVVASLRRSRRPAAPRTPPYLCCLVQGSERPLLARARIVTKNSANYPCAGFPATDILQAPADKARP